MPATPIQGGGFQDILGHPIAYGTLVLELSQPCLDTTTGAVQICSNIVSYSLDANGNIVTTHTPLVWANSSMSPYSYYMATVYTKAGALAWGPNPMYAVVSSGVVSITGWIPSNPG